jgi:hypothetical protein
MRATVRKKSYYSGNNFMCHLEQKKDNVRTNENKGRDKLLS